MDKPDIETADSRWKSLYRAGGVAPLVALVFYLTEIAAIAIGGLAGEPYPTSTSDWFSLFQRNRILGLLYVNALDIFSIALLGVMFLALYRALKQSDESYAAIAAFFAFVGIAVFIAPRAVVTFALLALGDRYAAATTETQRATLLTGGETFSALGQATPQTTGFFFVAVAGLILSVVMLRSKVFNKATAYVGILTGVITLANHISLLIVPALANSLTGVSGPFWIVWWILISVRLLKLGRTEKGAPQES
jgi:hypothetical protein